MIAQEACRAVLVDFSCRDIQHEGDDLRVVGIDKVAVDIEKCKSCEVTGALVAVREGMVSNDPVQLGCRQRENIRLTISRFVDRSCQAHFQ